MGKRLPGKKGFKPKDRPVGGAGNQYNRDPRQIQFVVNYSNPNSKTFGNALQSALAAGYSQEYAESITHQMPDWLSEILGNRQKMLYQAERVLAETLEEPKEEQAMGMWGPIFDKKTKKPIMRRNVHIMKLKVDTAKFVASTVGKKHYSSRIEMTGADGKDLNLDPKDKAEIESIFQENGK